MLATVLIGAAGMLGRGIDSKFVVVHIREHEPNAVTYGILALDRNILSRRVVDVPGYESTNFRRFPPLVMQAVWGDKTIAWTLSALDVWTGVLLPEVQIQTDHRTYLDAIHFRQHADGHWTVHDPSNFAIYYTYYTEGDALKAKAVEAASPSGAVLSNDGMRFVFESLGAIWITDMETGERSYVEHDVSSPADVQWSPEDRYISVFKRDNADSTMQVIDVENLEIEAELQGRALCWCGDQLIYVTNLREDVFEVRLYNLETGADELVLTRDLSDLAAAQRNLSVSALISGSCDWLIISQGNALTELMHLESGQTIPLGYIPFGVSFRIDDGAAIFLMVSPQLSELRRIVLDPATDGYEVLISLKRLNTSVTWIDDARGGIYLRGDDLVRIAPETSAETVLPFDDIQSFIVMPQRLR